MTEHDGTLYVLCFSDDGPDPGPHPILLIGPAEVCAERLAAFVDAGVRRLLVWSLADEARQLELFRERVTSLVSRRPWLRQDQEGCRR